MKAKGVAVNGTINVIQEVPKGCYASFCVGSFVIALGD